MANTSRTKLGNVLVATDFSETSDVAIARSLSLALAPGAVLELLHVVPESHDAATVPDAVRAAKRRLEDVVQHLAERRGIVDSDRRHIVVSVVHGEPAREIARRAHHARAELVVIGRSGTKSLRDWVLGSTAARLVRSSDVTVLVAGSASEVEYEKPLVALDMSESSRLALELTSRIVSAPGTRIDVLHVITPGSQSSPNDVVSRAESDETAFRPEWVAQCLDSLGVAERCNVIMRAGEARQLIVDATNERKCDLVSLGTKGRTGLASVTSGSVAESVLGSVACDVLIARSPRPDFDLR